MITLVQLQYFQIVAELQHITRAAEALNVSQTAVSAVLSRLETELGTKLFDKDGRNIRLNKQGQLFRSYADSILKQVDEARNALAEYDSTPKEMITYSLLAAQNYADEFYTFQIENPQTRLAHKEFSAVEIPAKLINEEIDFAIEGSLLSDLKKLDYFKLSEDCVYVAVPKEHPLADRKTLKAADLRFESFTAGCPTNSFRQLCDTICYRAGFIPNIVAECADSTLLERTASNLNTLFFCGPQRKAKIIENSKFHVIPLDEPDAVFPVIIYWKKGRKFSNAQQRFLEFWKNWYADKAKMETTE